MPRFEPNPTRRPTLVSGASSGIGEAVAYALADLGHPVALGARRVAETEAIADKIRSNGGEAFAHFLDVTDDASVEAFVTAAEEALGPAEIVVSGAGDLEFGAADQMDPASFAKQIDVHLVGAQRLAHRVLPGMRERRRGDFVLIGSDCADRQRPMMGAYDAAKAGLEAMGRQMRMELEGTGIRASIVRPGPTFTGMGMNSTPEILAPVAETWGKWGFARHGYMLRASDMANAVVAVVGAPRGVHLVLIEVQPEAPLAPLPSSEESK
ncbi:SDR family oxidoreductase [Prescottella equi]|uniref:Short chain dehydrogenase n=1 Tax=Rhodococcus hoagii (strain 103S) TaxID=685727 RepID=A0A3S5Y4J8_RHOH1|nr:SDR family oxidoreductase [Prescottella equi]MBM4535851.1 SDR family oxidoreductase [Prescottella equi]MBM4555407.1 SDR family oxidoreductase [Prescottella equi]MBM4732875.1 SDR family oxidoreductase [Prescottella equi]MDP8015772.1 SDR family oxidoreductase [Prescottella equi]NKR81551.1 SDR family oxidoreductase [Prescottella equi]